jgi:hypothetical protein
MRSVRIRPGSMRHRPRPISIPTGSHAFRSAPSTAPRLPAIRQGRASDGCVHSESALRPILLLERALVADEGGFSRQWLNQMSAYLNPGRWRFWAIYRKTADYDSTLRTSKEGYQVRTGNKIDATAARNLHGRTKVGRALHFGSPGSMKCCSPTASFLSRACARLNT